MIMLLLKICLLIIGVIVFAKAFYLQRKARTHIKKNKEHTIVDKIILNREPPPDEYLTDEGKRVSREVSLYGYIGVAIIIAWILLEYLS